MLAGVDAQMACEVACRTRVTVFVRPFQLMVGVYSVSLLEIDTQ
jgi:hypothetical protein